MICGPILSNCDTTTLIGTDHTSFSQSRVASVDSERVGLVGVMLRDEWLKEGSVDVGARLLPAIANQFEFREFPTTF